MKFTLRTLLLQSFLFSAAMALVLFHGETVHAHMAVSMIYSISFSMTRSPKKCPKLGVLGAVVGWAFAILLSVAIEFCQWFGYVGDAPYFDGEGAFHGLLVLPVFAFFYLLIPLSVMGFVIGCPMQFIRLTFLTSSSAEVTR